MILNADGTTYSYNYDYCDGSSPAVQSTTSCTIPIANLIVEPYNLPWGSSIYAKIQCYNSYGDSFFSTDGNGAVIYTEPDAPYDLVENPALRTADQLQFTWTAGVADGGTPVTHYRVSYGIGSGAYSVLADLVTQTSYTATGLESGTTYKFKVEAKTAYAYSAFSEVITMLCATLPLQPEIPSTAILLSDCVFTWIAPSDEGSPITGYKVSIRTKGLDFIVDSNVCDGGTQNSLDTLSCTVPLATLLLTPYNLEYDDGIYARVIATNLYGDSV